MAAFDLALELNPKFGYVSRVHFDELDPMGMLHNSRFAAHVERAIVSYYETVGRRWERRVEDNPDQFHVVRDYRIEFLAPVTGPGPLRIDLWVEHIGKTSCVYGFQCTSEDGSIVHARGERTIIKLDPDTHRPLPWTDAFRSAHVGIRKDLPAAP